LEEYHMGDRLDEFVGDTKATVGDLTGNEELEREGEIQSGTAKVRRETEGAIDKGIGGAQKAWGDLTDDPEAQAEGAARQLEGDAKRAG
jgi:uncharacterized protein YjbJ (UPF0337 family)